MLLQCAIKELPVSWKRLSSLHGGGLSSPLRGAGPDVTAGPDVGALLTAAQ